MFSFTGLTSIFGGGAGFTGGAATSGDAETGATNVGGIAPVNIGGFKSDGSAGHEESSVPDWAIWTAALVIAGYFAYRALKK